MNHRINTLLGIVFLGTLFFGVTFFIKNVENNVEIVSYFSPAQQTAQVASAVSSASTDLKFNDGSGSTAVDSSGNGNNGTLVGGASWTQGKSATALSFDGSSGYVRLSRGSGLPVYTPGGSESVSFWINGAPQATKYVWAESSASGSVIFAFSTDAAGKLNVQLRTDLSSTLLLKATSKVILDSTWHHVVWTDNAGVASLYIDGVKDATNFNYTPAGNFTITTDCIAAMCRGTTGYFFNGLIDEVKTYARELSSVEVTTLYNEGANASGSAPSGGTQPATPPSQPPVDAGTPTPLPTAVTQPATLTAPHLTIGNPAADWYGGPSSVLGYDILNLDLGRDAEGNMTDKVKVEWSPDGTTWAGNTNLYAPNLTISVPALPYNILQSYRLKAVSGTNVSDYSNVLTLVTLYPPSGLVASALDHSSVSLKWDYRGAKDKSGNEYEKLPGSGYKIERSTDSTFPAGSTKTITVSQPYTIVANPNNAAKKMVNFIDSDNFSTSVYYYRVRAFTTVGDGPTSKVISLAPAALPAPVDYAAAYTYKTSTNGKSSNVVAIIFSTSKTGQTGYRIETSDNGVDGWTVLKQFGLSLSSDPFLDSGLTPGSTHYYRVVAFNDVGDSPATVMKVVVPNIPSSHVTEWYLDNRSGGGTNDGTSWSDAWRDFSSINWFAIKPGDTIYISGGSSGQTYNESLYIPLGGVEGNPVTLKVGNDGGHNGKITLMNGITMRAPWVTIDGARNPDYTFSNTENIVGNQNIEVLNPNDFPCIYSNSPQGTRILWVDAHNCGSPTGPQSLGGNTSGVQFNGNSGINYRASEIAYSYIHDVWGTGIAVSGPASGYSFSKIHHNIIERVHNDYMIGSGGLDIYNNIGRNWIGPGIGHPDALQIWAPYTRIYNNVLYDTPGTLIYIQLQDVNSTGVQIFNNVMYPNAQVENSAITFTTIANNVTLSNVLVANNLVYNLNKAQLSLNVQPNITPIVVRSMTVKNNIFYVPTNPNNSGNFIDFRNYNYTPNDIAYDYNILAGTGSLGIGYGATSYSSPEAFSTAFSQYSHNTSARPQMVNPNNFDFRLLSIDSAARNKGDDLSSFCTAAYGWTSSNCPLTKDILGNDRTSAWDMGPYEYIGASDSVAPSAPAGFSISNITANSVSLNWTASTASDISGYKVFRNGTEIATLSATTYKDSNLTGATKYVYTVRAFDVSGNLSAPSATVTATTLSGSVFDSDAALKLHLTFQSGFANDPSSPNIFSDVSGNNNNALRYRTEASNPVTTGWPTATVGPDGNIAALFHVDYNDQTGRYPIYHKVGDYVGIPRSSLVAGSKVDATLDNLSQATFSIWAKYNRLPTGDISQNWVQALLESASNSTTVGAWYMGRWNSGTTQFVVKVPRVPADPANPTTEYRVNFNDPSTTGDAGGWHLYTATFNNGVLTTYQDGRQVGTGVVPSVTRLTLGSSKYICISCWQFSYPPQQPTGNGALAVYPNIGWFDGAMYDVRVYNRVLSSTEILSLFNSTGGQGGSIQINPLPVPTPVPTPLVDVIAPSLSFISASAVTTNSVVINWTTSEPATTQIQYGLTTNYGNSTPLISTLSTSHSQTLSALIPNTIYHYRLISKDAAGNTVTSSDGVFGTQFVQAQPTSTPLPTQSTPTPVVTALPPNATPTPKVVVVTKSTPTPAPPLKQVLVNKVPTSQTQTTRAATTKKQTLVTKPISTQVTVPIIDATPTPTPSLTPLPTIDPALLDIQPATFLGSLLALIVEWFHWLIHLFH